MINACPFCGYSEDVGSHGARSAGDDDNRVVMITCRVPKDATPLTFHVVPTETLVAREVSRLLVTATRYSEWATRRRSKNPARTDGPRKPKTKKHAGRT